MYLSTERPGNVRLVGGSNAWEGRVEIHLSGAWGTVAEPVSYHDLTNAAKVVCRQLGYSGGNQFCFVCLCVLSPLSFKQQIVFLADP